MIKKVVMLIGFMTGSAFGFTPQLYIQSISSLQSGATFYVSSGTALDFHASTAAVVGLTVSSVTVTSSATFRSPVYMGAPASAVQISSNTILQNATFYSGNAPILISTYIAFTPTNLGIKGTPTNDNADVGSYGEYQSSTTTSQLNCAPTGQFFDLGSVTLTAGDHDIYVGACFINNGATAQYMSIGLGTTAGNSAAGLTEGDTLFNQLGTTAVYDQCFNVSGIRKSISSTTTFYLKIRCAYSAGTLQTIGSRISSRRDR